MAKAKKKVQKVRKVQQVRKVQKKAVKKVRRVQQVQKVQKVQKKAVKKAAKKTPKTVTKKVIKKVGKKVVKKVVRKVGTKTTKAARPVPKKVKKAPKTVTKAPKKTAPVAKATVRPSKKAAPTKAAPKKAAPARKPVAKAKVAAPPAPARLNRERKRLADVEDTAFSAEADDSRLLRSARSGHDELASELRKHTETSPELTAGDVDANWQDAYAVGDEAPGGDNPTPDQDRVDDIGRALGVEYDDDEELMGGAEITERDAHRWELDPASKDDEE